MNFHNEIIHKISVNWKKKLHFFQKFFSFEVRYSLKNIKYKDVFYLKKIDLETLKKINQIIDDIEQSVLKNNNLRKKKYCN